MDSVYRALETIISLKYISIEAEKEISRIKQLDPQFDETTIFDVIQPIYGKNYFFEVVKNIYRNNS